MTLPRVFALVAAVVLVLGLGVSASAVQVAHSEGYLAGTLAEGTGLACNAVVDLTEGVYTYTYTLIYNQGIKDPLSGNAPYIHLFDVENPNGKSFFGAAGQGFTAPADGNDLAVEWFNGEIREGETRTFSYKSLCAPMEIEVFTWVVDDGTYATGTTLGMGSMIPEPSSLLALVLGTAGLVPFAIRRRK